MRGLNVRRRKFVSSYLNNGFNGVQAAISAGFSDHYPSAQTEAWRLLRNAEIKREINKRLAKVLTKDEVLERLSDVAEADTKIDGSMRMKALELLGKSHKLFIDKVETEDKTPLSPDTLQTLKALAKQLSGQDLTDSQVKQLLADSFARAEQPIDGGEA